MLAGADLVQAAADESPADAPDGERDFADCHDVPDGQFPGRFSGVVKSDGGAARAMLTAESLGLPCGDLLALAPGELLAGATAQRRGPGALAAPAF